MSKGLENFIKFIDKHYKKNDDIIFSATREFDVVSSGSAIVDMVSGIGGLLVKGRISEISGLESSGKTTLCFQTAAQAQKKGWVGVFVDTEHAYHSDYAEKLGLKLDNETFMVVQPTYAEQAEKLIDGLVSNSKVDYVIIDSIAAMRPSSQMYADDSSGKGQVKAAHAAFWSSYSPKLQAICKDNNIAVLITNQLRQKLDMGVFATKAVNMQGVGTGFSQDTTWITTGGNAIKYSLSLRFILSVRKTHTVENTLGKKIPIGNIIEIANVKNKLSSPYTKASFCIRYRGGLGTDDVLMMIESLREWKCLPYTNNKYYLNTEEGVYEFKKLSECEDFFRDEKNFNTLFQVYKSAFESINKVDDTLGSRNTLLEDGDITIEEV